MDEKFFFKGDTLPTKGEVFKFINSRTNFGNSSRSEVIAEAAKKINKIWTSADTCPMSQKSIVSHIEKLLKDRQTFLRKNGSSQHVKTKVHESLADSTRKRRFPSSVRQPSKRILASKCKEQVAQPAFEESITEDVTSLLSDIIEKVASSQECQVEEKTNQPPRKNLRAHCSAEQSWLTHVGCHLFDVFSEQERAKVISENKAFDEEFLSDQRGPRKLFMDTSKVTEEFKLDLAQKSERDRRHKNYLASATMEYSAISDTLECTADENEEVQDSVSDIGEIQYISAVRTRSTKSSDLEAALMGTSKRSIASQTDDSLFPNVSTRLYSKRNKTISRRLNPRLLATGSLMMGVAGVSTKQAILCTKIAANTLFHQNYILPPSLEKEYRKKMKLRRKLAKMKLPIGQESSQSGLAQQTRQEVADVVTSVAEVETDPQQQQTNANGNNTDTDEIEDLIEIEGKDVSEQSQKEVLSRMLCTPSALRAAHHLISTLGEQEQALEMINLQNANLIPDGTARQGGWGKMAGAVMKVGDKYRPLRLQTLGSENHSSWVETLIHMIKRLAIASGQDVANIWKSIMVLVSDMCKVNMNLAIDVAKELGCAWQPGQAYCNLHPRLMMSRSIVEIWKGHQSKIGHDKLFPSLEYCNLDASDDSLVKQVLDALMNLTSKQYAERSWNKYHEFTEWLDRKGIKNETGPLREIRFGELEAKALTGAYHLSHIEQFLQIHSEIRNKLTCFLRSAFPMRDVILFYLIGAALIGIHIGEPYVNLLMVKRAKMSELIKIFPQFYKEMLNPPISFTQLTEPAIPCLREAWVDPNDEVDPPYPKTQMDFLQNYLKETDSKYLELFCKDVAKEIAVGFKRQKGDVFGFGDGSQPQLNILSQVSEENLDNVETTSIAVEQFFGEVDQKTKVSGGCQSKNKICDDLIIKHTEDLIQKHLKRENFNLRPLRLVAKEVDEIQLEFDKRQKSLMAAGLRDDEAVILTKESQVQTVVRQCKESHGGPVQSLAELEQLIKDKENEKALASALNLEIRYRKFTCLLKVATNNELFRQRGIDNKLRIIHLKQLLTDDTRPKCHASISDIEALYDEMEEVGVDERYDAAPEVSNNPSEWFSSGCWPLKEHEHIVVLVGDSFCIGDVKQCHQECADVLLMKSVKVRGQLPLSHWANDDSAKPTTIFKESILPLRPVFEVKGSRKTLKLFLVNFDIIKQFVESLEL